MLLLAATSLSCVGVRTRWEGEWPHRGLHAGGMQLRAQVAR